MLSVAEAKIQIDIVLATSNFYITTPALNSYASAESRVLSESVRELLDRFESITDGSDFEIARTTVVPLVDKQPYVQIGQAGFDFMFIRANEEPIYGEPKPGWVLYSSVYHWMLTNYRSCTFS